MPQIRVLVADDSALSRDVITNILSMDNGIIVVGQASNGREAVEKALALKPDLVTMDLEMPIMNGIEAIEKIMGTKAVPILVISAKDDARSAFAAISKGALEVLSKTEIDPETPQVLIQKIKLLSRVKVISHIRATGQPRIIDPLPSKAGERPFGAAEKPGRGPRVIAIAASTGGPKALSTILPELPENLPSPILIAQHISDGFVAGMVDWLDKVSALKVKLAEDGEPVVEGIVYVSPSEKHMEVRPDRRIGLVERGARDIYRPSCDLLLSSVAERYGTSSVGIILTGMGSDGTNGCRIRRVSKPGVAQPSRRTRPPRPFSACPGWPLRVAA